MSEEFEGMTRDELRRKLSAAYAELERRRRRDIEIAKYLPAIAARLTVIAADAAVEHAPKESWERDPEIDWTGIEGAPK